MDLDDSISLGTADTEYSDSEEEEETDNTVINSMTNLSNTNNKTTAKKAAAGGVANNRFCQNSTLGKLLKEKLMQPEYADKKPGEIYDMIDEFRNSAMGKDKFCAAVARLRSTMGKNAQHPDKSESKGE